MKLYELFDQPYEIEWRDDLDVSETVATFITSNGHTVIVTFENVSKKDGMWDVSFQLLYRTRGWNYRRTYDITHTGDAPKILATVISVIRSFVAKNRPKYIFFSSKTTETSRIKLYDAMVRRAVSTISGVNLITDLDPVPEDVADYAKDQKAHGLHGWLFSLTGTP